MKIVVVHNRYRSGVPSGEDRVVDTESAALRDAGHAVIAFERCSDEISTWSLPRRAALPFTLIGSRSSRVALAEVLDRERPDVVHVHNTFPLLTPSVLHACDDAGVPVVVTLHNSRLSCARGDFFRDGVVCRSCAGATGLAALAHRCYRGSAMATVPVLLNTTLNQGAWQTLPSAYIFVSESHRKALEHVGLPTERSFVKWNLVLPPPVFERRPEALVAYLGRLDEAKGITLLMEAWDRFRIADPRRDLRLTIGGDGPLAPLVRTWAEGRDEVEILGLLDREGCRSLLERARAVVVPSLVRETFGLVVAEAMALGAPPVVADHGALPELVREGVDGARFKAGDADDLARVLRDVANRPEHWSQLGAAALRSFAERFSPEANLQELLDIYRFAIENPVSVPKERVATAIR
jgi:glycosyltransferase involved in cell wall biosynthesis